MCLYKLYSKSDCQLNRTIRESCLNPKTLCVCRPICVAFLARFHQIHVKCFFFKLSPCRYLYIELSFSFAMNNISIISGFTLSDRLGRHGKVFLTVPSQDTTAEQKFIQKGEGAGTDSMFDLDPKDNIFIVGGVPPDVKVQQSFFSVKIMSQIGHTNGEIEDMI